MHDRPSEPNRWRMPRAYTRIFVVLAAVAGHRGVAARLVKECHMNHGGIAAHATQHEAARRELIDRLAPAFFTDQGAGPRPVPLGYVAMRNSVENGHGYPSSLATFSKPFTNGAGK